MKNAVLVYILLCAISAQAAPKSAELLDYLGNRVNERPQGRVSFVFTKITLTRTGDGQKTYGELLRHVVGYQDADAGYLHSIKVEGVQVPRSQRPVEASVGESARSIPGEGWTLPDSISTARTIEGLKQKIDGSSGKIWGQTLQWWDFVIYCMKRVFWALLCLGGLARYAAKAATNESRITSWGSSVYGGWVARFGSFAIAVTFTIVVMSMLVLLAHIFICCISGRIGELLWLFLSWQMLGVVAWFALLNLANRFTDAFVPNPRVSGGGYPRGEWNGSKDVAKRD